MKLSMEFGMALPMTQLHVSFMSSWRACATRFFQLWHVYVLSGLRECIKRVATVKYMIFCSWDLSTALRGEVTIARKSTSSISTGV